MAKLLSFIVFVIALQLIGGLIGYTFQPGEWFATLQKPFFNPPGNLFALVWPILYFLIAVAGWRVFTSEGATPGWGLWVGQMVLNWLWSPVFFGGQHLFWSMFVLLGTLLFSIRFVSVVWDKDKIAGTCFIPYVAWLSFALLLNVTIWSMN